MTGLEDPLGPAKSKPLLPHLLQTVLPGPPVLPGFLLHSLLSVLPHSFIFAVA